MKIRAGEHGSLRISEIYSGEVDTDDGVFGVCMRDSGIEVHLPDGDPYFVVWQNPDSDPDGPSAVVVFATGPSYQCVARDVSIERWRQEAKWGEQNHPDGTCRPGDLQAAYIVRDLCDKRFSDGDGTWRDILAEEVAEAYACSDRNELRGELVQIAAVAMAWIEAIDRRPRSAAEAAEREG
jgi:hypothetical protein